MDDYDAVFYYRLAIEDLLKKTEDVGLLDLIYKVLVESKK